MHYKRRSRCKICDGSEMCVHDKIKRVCGQCRRPINSREPGIGVSTQFFSSTLEEIFQMTPLSGHNATSAHQVGDKQDLENREHNPMHARFSWLQALCPVFANAHAAKLSPISSDMAKALHMQSKSQSISKKKANTRASKKVGVLTIEKMSKNGTLQIKKSRQQSRLGCDGLQIQQADTSIKADEMLVGGDFVLTQAEELAPRCSETTKNQRTTKDSVKNAVVKKKNQQMKKSRQQSRLGCDGLQIQQADASIKADEMLVGGDFVLTQAEELAPTMCSETTKNRRTTKDSVKNAVVKKKNEQIPAIDISAKLPPPKARSDSMSTFAHTMYDGCESLENEHFSHSEQIGIWSCEASFNFKLCDVEASIETETLPMGKHDFSMHESLDLHFVDHWQEWMCNSERQHCLKNRQDDDFEMIPTDSYQCEVPSQFSSMKEYKYMV